MKLEELKNKKILIVGKGIEGNAAYKYLKKHFPDSIIDIVDQKDGEDYLTNQNRYDIAIKSPGVKLELISIPYTTPTNILLSNAKGKVIGVTGTKGKSTTSTLIYEMLKREGFDAYLAGNIGQSPLDFLDNLNDQSWTVLEMSSFQLKDVKVSPYIAVLLMVVQEHLDYHETQEAYVNAKRNILRFQNSSDFAIINRDYPASNESDVHTQGKVFYVSRERIAIPGCYIKNGRVQLSVFSDQLSDKSSSVIGKPVNRKQTNQNPKTENRELITETIIGTKDILLPGKHNLENVCAAVMAATLAGVSKKNIVSVLKSFKGLPHRLEFVGKVNNIKFFNDSLATLPQATIEALETLPDTETLIAGGYDRGLDFAALGEAIAKSHIKTLVLFPTTGEKIWKAVCSALSEKNRPKKFEVTKMDKAVKIAFAETLPGKTVLLSPASASFGIFKNYKDRGEQFKREVNRLS